MKSVVKSGEDNQRIMSSSFSILYVFVCCVLLPRLPAHASLPTLLGNNISVVADGGRGAFRRHRPGGVSGLRYGCSRRRIGLRSCLSARLLHGLLRGEIIKTGLIRHQRCSHVLRCNEIFVLFVRSTSIANWRDDDDGGITGVFGGRG